MNSNQKMIEKAIFIIEEIECKILSKLNKKYSDLYEEICKTLLEEY